MAGKLRDGPRRGRHKEYVSPGNVQVACNCHETREQTCAISTVEGLLRGHSPVDARGLCGGIHSRRFFNEFLFHPGNLLYHLKGVLLDPLYKGLPAIDILGYKLLIVEPLLDDDVVEAHGQGCIGTRTKLEPEIGLIGEKALSGIYDNQLASLFVGPPEYLAFVLIRIGPLGVTGPHDNALGAALVITDGQVSAGNDRCPDP